MAGRFGAAVAETCTCLERPLFPGLPEGHAAAGADSEVIEIVLGNQDSLTGGHGRRTDGVHGGGEVLLDRVRVLASDFDIEVFHLSAIEDDYNTSLQLSALRYW